MKNVGIVGSRRRQCEEEVRALVRSLAPSVTIISGGAKGVDSWAADEAKRLGIPLKVFLPQKKGPGYGWACRAYSERNKKIAYSVDILYAFVSEDRKGGTEQTIRYARKRGIEVIIC